MNTEGFSSHESTTLQTRKVVVGMVGFSGFCIYRFYAPDNPVAYYNRRTAFAISHLVRQFAVEDVARYLLQSLIFNLALEKIYHNVSLPLYNQGKSYICVTVMLIYVYVFCMLL